MVCGIGQKINIKFESEISIDFVNIFNALSLTTTDIAAPLIIGYGFLSKYTVMIYTRNKNLIIDNLKIKFEEQVLSKIKMNRNEIK